MRSSLWLNVGAVPWEVLELRLCRDIYHCTPTQLDDVPWDRVNRHIIVMEAERDVGEYE